MILADTSVWVWYFRDRSRAEAHEVRDLLVRRELAMTGVVLVELLRGARDKRTFLELQGVLDSVPFLETSGRIWARAAEVSFDLRQSGQQLPLSDVLVACVALEHHCALYALDDHFRRIPGLKLHTPAPRSNGRTKR